MDYRLLDTHEKREEYARKLVNISLDFLTERGLDPEEEIQKTIAELSSEEERQNSTKDWRESYLRDVSDFLGVLSLSSNYMKPNLWAYYGANHSGFALGLNRAELEGFTNFLGGGMVIYQKDYPVFSPLDIREQSELSFLSLMHKHSSWKEEEEYRLIMSYFDLAFKGLEPTNELRKLSLPNHIIASVTLGLRVTDENRTAAIQALSRKDIPIFQCQTKDNSFEIERIRIA
jgi:hypothetical protein